MSPSALSRLRRPEYTGENRCWPCTVLNVALVALGSVAVGLLSPVLGALSLLGGLVLVALRGYVVPSTPEFAPRVAAALPVDLGFHQHRTDGGRTSESLTGADEVDGETLVRRLAEAGLITADESGELFLATETRRTWEAGMRRLRDVSDDELAAATASAAPFPAEGRVEGDWVVVTRTGDADGTAIDGDEGDEVWLSRAHAVADTAAVAAMGDAVDAETAAQAAMPFRLFIETCPLCGGDTEETVVRECCGGTQGVYDNPETPVLACVACGEVLYEF
ncbi:hypothetical protein [Salinigranum halophilum]|uniref:hypothetical protein n=1 Tax=Salinigranum halophilum TaxID=2565931 RepID=UPI0010A885EA|nr:hypothetical protein [Salinigranum halophilum]